MDDDLDKIEEMKSQDDVSVLNEQAEELKVN